MKRQGPPGNSSSRNLALVLTALICLLAVLGCAAAPTPQERTKATLRLDFLTFGYQAPFFVALDKGWYAAKGIDLEILDGQGSANTVQSVAGGTDTFGFADGPTMVQGIAQGMPLKSVAGIWRKSPNAVLARTETGVTKPKDLEGKKMGFAPGSAQETLWPSFALANQVDTNKVNVLTIDVPSKLKLIATKDVDFLVTQVTVIPRVEAQGIKLTSFLYSDYGLDITGYSLMATDQTIKDKPNLVQGFVAATIQGWQFARDNTQDAIAILKKYRSAATPTSLEEMTITFPLFDSRNSQGKPIGWQAKDDWTSTISLLNSLGALKKPVETDSVFTNAFVPEK